MPNSTKEKEPVKCMTEEEKQQWNELYEYVRSEILQYDKNQSLSPKMVLRLKGLTKGKLLANKLIKDNADYSFSVILYTFQACKAKIMYAIQNKSFKDEIAKFMYITAIVENNINDIYIRLKNAKQIQQKTDNINIEKFEYNGAEYLSKTKDISDKFNDLW